MSAPRPPAVLLTQEGHVATLTLNQPDTHNPMSPELIEDLPGVIADIRHNDHIRAVVITGTGMFPLSHLQTMTVIFWLSMALCRTAGVSSAWHSTTLSHPQASATAANDVFWPA